MLKISHVIKNSPAYKADIKRGDRLIRLNGERVTDHLDFLFHVEQGDNYLEFTSGELKEVFAQTASRDSLGIDFVPMEIRRCTSNCIFCFVSQLPKGLRKDLYIKDDDFRLSFLDGCFITGENLSEIDIERILQLRLSPLYISVHSTDPAVRGRLFGKKSPAPILPLLTRFASNGITLHLQTVICPGLNDGSALNKTLHELAGLGNSIASVGVVPVGLTKFRKKLFHIEPVDKKISGEVLDVIDAHNRNNPSLERRVAASDEFYIHAERELPRESYYGDYPQLGNGLGLIRWWERIFLEAEAIMSEAIGSSRELGYGRETSKNPSVLLFLLTGKLAAPFIAAFGESISRLSNRMKVETIAAENEFLGSSISVASLLGGGDVIREINKSIEEDSRPESGGKSDETIRSRFAVLPPDLLNDDGETLDGLTLIDIINATGTPCVIAPQHPAELARILSSLLLDGGFDHFIEGE